MRRCRPLLVITTDGMENASRSGIGEDRAVTFKNESRGTTLNYAAMAEAVFKVRGGRKISK